MNDFLAAAAAAFIGSLLLAAPAIAEIANPTEVQSGDAAAQGGGGKGDRHQAAGWVTKCNDATKPAERSCATSRALVDPQSRKLLMAVTFRIAPPTRKPEMKLLMPTGVYLPAGVTVAIDEGAPLQLKFETCSASACLVTVPVDGAMLQRMRKGKVLKVVVQDLDQKPIDAALRLDGFGRAYDQIK